MGRRRIWHLTQ
ncbi:60S ribosomal protein L5-A, partial [Trichinella spiralis]